MGITIQNAQELVSVLIQMALADGSIDPREVEVIRRIGEANGLSQTAMDVLFENPTQNPTQITNLESLRKLPYEAKFDLLYNLLVLMKADLVVMNEEITMAQKIANSIGFDLVALMELYPYAHPNMKDPTHLKKLKKKLEKFLIK